MAAAPIPPPDYERLITRGIRGMSVALLAEVADFVFFLRKRSAEPEAFLDEIEVALLGTELRQAAVAEWAHLESEIDGYERHYPRG